MNNLWPGELQRLLDSGSAVVMVTLLTTRGSTPRAAGSKMLVTQDNIFASIGGGHLEHRAIGEAREMLQLSERQPRQQRYNLGASLGQCCGGAVDLLLEPLYPSPLSVVVYGAGHIAQALIPILGTLPCQVHWVDERQELLPEQPAANTQIHCDEPMSVVEALPADSYVLIMTHHHGLDLQLCEAWLKRSSAQFVGVIGSSTKRARFTKRLLARGLDERQLAKLHCPIGQPTIGGKLPGEIAVSVAGELINFYQQYQAQPSPVQSTVQASSMSKL